MEAPAFSGANYDVPDSTDWLGTPLAGMMPVEQAFRCHVCKDFYNSPMLTSCNHTFCSLCIRRCLSVEGKCPLCRMSDQESKLRGNWALREAVDAFCKARAAILEVARNPPTPASTGSASPKRKAAEVDSGGAGPRSKRLRTSARLSKTKGAEAAASMAQDEVDVSEDDDGADYEPDDGLVACPICFNRMKEWQVSKHMDTSCLGPSGSTTNSSTSKPITIGSTSQLASKVAERLPSLSYTLLNDSALRKKLAALRLSTGGPRQLLERRHKEWVTIWNANCDSAQPKRTSELLHDLDVWERTLGGRAPATSRSAAMGAQIKDKDFDGAAWSTRHDTSFKDLIANARSSRAKAEKPAEENRDAPSSDQGAGANMPEKSDNDVSSSVVDLTEPPSSQPLINGELVAPISRPGVERDKIIQDSASETSLQGISSGGDIRYGVD